MIDEEQVRIVSWGNAVRRCLPVHSYRNIPDSWGRFGIRIRYFDDERYQSFLEWDVVHQCPVIGLNTKLAKIDRNFALLHELGHLILEYHWSPKVVSLKPAGRLLNVEYVDRPCRVLTDEHGRDLVDRFAATYLIPTYALRHILRGHDLDYLELIREIAGHFVVPYQIARTRLNIFLAVE